MKEENRSLLIKYIVCVCVASLLTLLVFALQGFFNADPAHDLQVLSDGFTTSGGLLLMFAGMMFISGQGALIGITYVLRYVVLTFVPMGRSRQELYRDYRERKLKELKKTSDHVLLIVGAVFTLIGIVFAVIWYTKCYNMPV